MIYAVPGLIRFRRSLVMSAVMGTVEPASDDGPAVNVVVSAWMLPWWRSFG